MTRRRGRRVPKRKEESHDADARTARYRFEKTGRYLVLCINRVHFLNDWMFGFVNVTEAAADKN